MAEQFLEFTIEKQAHPNDIIIAALEHLPVDSYWEDDHLKFYMARSTFNRQMESELNELAQKWDFIYSFKVMADVNWNERWESGFEPVEVGKFCLVRASFHESRPGFDHEIIVDPKMAFGTGHHATTFMMIRHMSSIDFRNKSVLDFGTGTGILAILASRRGAEEVLGIDIESKAIENAISNKEINETPDIQLEVGDMGDIPEKTYDIILANINRNVLIDAMPGLEQRLSNSGHLIMSGILLQDEEIMKRHILKEGLKVGQVDKMDDWLSFVCHK